MKKYCYATVVGNPKYNAAIVIANDESKLESINKVLNELDYSLYGDNVDEFIEVCGKMNYKLKIIML